MAIGRMGFDLESSIDYAQEYSGGLSGNFFQDHDVTLAPGEAQTFDIYVGVKQLYCQFYFQMTVSTPEGLITEKLEDDGTPFKLTAIAGSPNPGHPFYPYAVGYIAGLTGTSFVQVNPKTFDYQQLSG